MTDNKNEKEEDFDCVDENCRFRISKSAEDKVDDLKNAIKELGYKIEDTEEGEIKISND
jgi:hypothetical protein